MDPPRFSAPPLLPAMPAAAAAMAARASAPTRDSVLLAAALQAASVPAADARRKLWMIGLLATAIVSSIATLGAAYFFWGKSDPGPGPVGSAVAASVPVLDPTGAAPALSGTGAVDPPATAPSVAPKGPPLPRECKANVRSYPQGAAVGWNGESLGTTPLANVAVPCGRASVTFDVRGYEPGEREAMAMQGKSAGVFMRLAPRLIPIEITSAPPGAQVLVDGRSVGHTPAKLAKVGFKEMKLVVVLPGYLAWTQTVTPEPPSVSVHADLKRK
jgi:hypothetical protein